MRFESGVLAAALALATAVATVHCGGRIADDTSQPPSPSGAPDGSVWLSSDGSAEASDPPETSTDTCSGETLDIEQSGTSTCSTSQKWSCGASHYEFHCVCPYATCECFEDGIPKKAFITDLQCPGCVIPPGAITSCGFPH